MAKCPITTLMEQVVAAEDVRFADPADEFPGWLEANYSDWTHREAFTRFSLPDFIEVGCIGFSTQLVIMSNINHNLNFASENLLAFGGTRSGLPIVVDTLGAGDSVDILPFEAWEDGKELRPRLPGINKTLETLLPWALSGEMIDEGWR